jgi:hypothetical protein
LAAKPASENWSVSHDELAQGFRGRKFGELVLYHVKRQSVFEISKGVAGTVSLLPKELQGVSEQWIDLNNRYAPNEEFWRSDCGDIYLSIIERARQFASRTGTQADSNTLLNLFQIVVLSFAYTAHLEPSSKAFIQKAIGTGFLRRFLG